MIAGKVVVTAAVPKAAKSLVLLVVFIWIIKFIATITLIVGIPILLGGLIYSRQWDMENHAQKIGLQLIIVGACCIGAILLTMLISAIYFLK